MDTRRFTMMNGALSSRLSRRAALPVAAFTASLVTTAARGTDAQGTPAAATAQRAPSDASFLFVQSATSGTFAVNPGAGTTSASGTPVAGDGADFLLTLEGHTGNTVYFSDRPERIFGEAPTQAFLDGLGFPLDNPPNAALVTNDVDGNEDVLVVELTAPEYDAGTSTITYGVNILSDYEGGLDFIASRQQDEDLAPGFGAASLFIDDCSDEARACVVYQDLGEGQGATICAGNITVGFCWDWEAVSCQPCRDYSTQCNATYSDQCGDHCLFSGDSTCNSA